MRTAMIAITTSSSISVKARRAGEPRRVMADSDAKGETTKALVPLGKIWTGRFVAQCKERMNGLYPRALVEATTE
jgi:hypothetical protein